MRRFLRSSRALSLAMLAAVVAVSGGCNLLGVVAYKALPPPRVPAAYELAAEPTAVVVKVDEAVTGEQGPLDAESLAVALERALERNAEVQVAPEAVARQRVEVWLGAAGATGALGSEFEQGQASARVRVLDGSGEQLWPEAGDGFVVSAQTPRIRAANPAELRRATLRALAVQVAALFHSREMGPAE